MAGIPVTLTHSSPFVYGGGIEYFLSGGLIVEVPGNAVGQFLRGVMVDHVMGFNRGFETSYFQLHDTSQQEQPPTVNSPAKWSIEVPGNMPFSWSPPGGFHIATHSFWWFTSAQPMTYQPHATGGPWWVYILGRATVGYIE